MILLDYCMARNTIARQAPGLFDIDNCLAELSAMGDCLQRLDSIVDWNIFVDIIEPHLGSANNTSLGGRPAYPVKGTSRNPHTGSKKTSFPLTYCNDIARLLH